MTTIKSLITLIILSCFVNTSSAQFGNTSIKKRIEVAKAQAAANKKNTKVITTQNNRPRMGMTTDKYLWIFPANGQNGHWVSLKPGELQNRTNQKADYTYTVNAFSNKAYGKATPSYTEPRPPVKQLDIKKVKDNYDNLKDDLVKDFSMGDKEEGRPGIYYFNKIELNMFLCASNKDLIIVTDTLFVPVAQKGNAALSSLWYNDRNYIKIIANCIVYESPVRLISSNRTFTDFVFVTNETIFKSPYKNLNSNNLNPAPPFFRSSERNAKGYIDPMTEKERILLNRLYVNRMTKILEILKNGKTNQQRQNQLLAEYENIFKNKVNKSLATKDWNTQSVLNRLDSKMEETMNWIYTNKMKNILTQLNATSNVWKVDQLLEDFQNIRRNKINESFLDKDEKTNALFNESCKTFQIQYGNKGVQELRKEGELMILVNGEIENLHQHSFKYYTFPTKASLIPVKNQTTGESTALGFVKYYSTGNSKFELAMEIALFFDQAALKNATKKLKENGLHLEQNFPVGLVSLDEQPLKVNGKTIGKIIPIGNQNIRFEITLKDDGLSLLELFTGSINFKLDYSIEGYQQSYSQALTLDINTSLLKNLNQGKILDNFSVIEMSRMTDVVKISSQLNAELENEGTLNFVEITLEFNFENETVFWGPFRFSSYSTHASEMTIPFLKYSDSYSVTVKGYADYENGRRNIEVFTADNQFVTLEENIFKK